MRTNLLIGIGLVAIFAACKKEVASNCSTNIKLTSSTATPTAGESFTITALKVSDNDLFQWSGPGNYSSVYGNTLQVNDPGYESRGWYYCTKSNTECGQTIHDSIFIDLKLKQGNAPCTIANNSLNGNAIPATSFYSVIKNVDPNFNGKQLYATATIGYPTDFRVLFNPNNGDAEPVDGIYTTSDRILFSQTDPYIRVSLSFVYGGQFFHCHPDKDVFVNHINGKLSASFCDMPFSNGTNIINLSGRLTEQ